MLKKKGGLNKIYSHFLLYVLIFQIEFYATLLISHLVKTAVDEWLERNPLKEALPDGKKTR